MKEIFDHVSIRCSRITTQRYSTSFSLGILCLNKTLRDPIYSIYGFVRFADEIVDSFHGYDKKQLFERFKTDTYLAIEQRISLNPILNSFQHTVHQYQINTELIDQFLKSMEMDLTKKTYDQAELQQYILGSAEVVGLMCLRVFCQTNTALYEQLKLHAMSLGSAFQKVNFLRDLHADFAGMGRTYFPEINLNHFDDACKREVEKQIAADFNHGFAGIKQLPATARFGVYIAYVYYLALFRKIQNTPASMILRNRISIRNRHKATLLAYSYVKHHLNLL